MIQNEHSIKRSHAKLAACAALALTFFAILAAQAIGDASDTVTTASVDAATASHPSLSEAPAQAKSTLRVFRGEVPTVAAADKAAGGLHPLKVLPAADTGFNPQSARQVATAVGDDVILIPRTDSVCLYAPDPRDPNSVGGTCRSLDDVKSGKLVVTYYDEKFENARVYAVVPDGATSATVTVADGNAKRVAATNSVVSLDIKNPKTIEIAGSKNKL